MPDDHHKNLHNLFVRSARIKMWQESLFLAILIFLPAVWYVVISDKAVGIPQLSKALAATSAIMIGISFALSGFSYYWDFLDKKLAYRKYIGLTGYWCALAYSLSLMYLQPHRYWYGLFHNIRDAEILLGLFAMTIFSFMTLISTNYMMRKIGPVRWRKLMRLGYVAYFALVLRAYILEKQLWIFWFQNIHTAPPPRLLLAFFAISVILFRLSMIISQKQKKTAHIQHSQS